MKKIILILIFNFLFLFSFGQNTITGDTIHSNISVMYEKVVFSDDFACKAELKMGYVKKSNLVFLFFELPNYDSRYKTTKADYAIIKLKNRELKLQNRVEAMGKIMMFKFLFAISKDSLLALLPEQLKKINFYFTPNEDFIKKSLATEIGFDAESIKELGELAKKTVKTTISKPDKKQLNELKLWLEKL